MTVLGRLLELLLKKCSPLMKYVLKPLAKSVLMSLTLTAAASAKDAAIQKKIFKNFSPIGSGMIWYGIKKFKRKNG